MYTGTKFPIFKTHFHFPGITVLVPRQGENEIVVIDKGSFPEDIPDQPDIFTKIRCIANIVFYNKADVKHVNPVTIFNPPVEVRVGYNCFDVMHSQNDIHRLKLACWDGIENKWVIISDPNSDFDYFILPPGTGQVAEFKILSWPADPMVAWGK